ncbi:MAG: twin-arginine translocase TatA/TatE family subunit [Chloroflexi bacterium]|nr:twin-arginine translocase TatA/TatE family subunit [Chloroflexota bacterium]
MGFHFMDMVIIAGIVLALFGPKALQSMARSAGKGVSQAKAMKDKVMSELPVEEISKMTEHIPQVPLNSRQAIEMLLTPEEKKKSGGAEQKEALKSETAEPSQTKAEL